MDAGATVVFLGRRVLPAMTAGAPRGKATVGAAQERDGKAVWPSSVALSDHRTANKQLARRLRLSRLIWNQDPRRRVRSAVQQHVGTLFGLQNHVVVFPPDLML